MYASSVHCSYYCCLQLMKHIVAVKLGVTYEDQDNEIKSTSSKTHVYVINKIGSPNNIKDPLDRREFRANIYQLKDLRVESDYKNISIDPSKSQKAYSTACSILEQLKTNFKL
jgi:hypothetical protein